VGIDEVGRGALAGPLTVGAVVVTKGTAPPEGLTDSKALTPKQREELVGLSRSGAPSGRSARLARSRSMSGVCAGAGRRGHASPLGSGA
jgi:hypothetical protein